MRRLMKAIALTGALLLAAPEAHAQAQWKQPDGSTTAGTTILIPDGIGPGNTSSPPSGSNGLPITYADLLATGTITSTQSVGIDVSGKSTVAAIVSAGWSGTISIEASIDGISYVQTTAVVVTSGAIVSSLTGPNSAQLQINSAGFKNVRLRGNTVSAGTVTVSLRASGAPATFMLDNPLPAGTNTIGNVGVVAGTALVGKVGFDYGSQVLTASLTRPANAPTYVAGQAICHETVAPCIPLSWTIANAANGTGEVFSVRAIKNDTVIANSVFSVYFFSAAPTLTNITDALAYSPPWADVFTTPIYLGRWDCPAPLAANVDNTVQECASTNPNNTMGFVADASSKIYGQVVVQAGLVGTNGGIIGVQIKARRN